VGSSKFNFVPCNPLFNCYLIFTCYFIDAWTNKMNEWIKNRVTETAESSTAKRGTAEGACLQRVVGALVVILYVEFVERQHDFAHTRSDDLVLFVLVVEVVRRIVRRLNDAARSLERLLWRVRTCRRNCTVIDAKRDANEGNCAPVGVAQWLERRSLAVELFLICAWSMVDMWPLRG